MAVRVAPKADHVVRCIPRQDGGYWILTKKSGSAVSVTPIPEGTQVTVQDGRAVRLNP